MKILGISPLDKDATVSFVEDGRGVWVWYGKSSH